MIYKLDFRYDGCHECDDRSGCDYCRALIEEILYRVNGITGVDIRMRDKHLRIETDNLTQEELLEVLSDAGITAE